MHRCGLLYYDEKWALPRVTEYTDPYREYSLLRRYLIGFERHPRGPCKRPNATLYDLVYRRHSPTLPLWWGAAPSGCGRWKPRDVEPCDRCGPTRSPSAKQRAGRWRSWRRCWQRQCAAASASSYPSRWCPLCNAAEPPPFPGRYDSFKLRLNIF